MTGTPLDLTPFGPLLKSVGYVYWLIALGLAAFALWVPGRWWVKLPIAALILGGFAYPVVTHKEVQQQQVDAARTRLDEAMALFKKRCESSGEKIARTVESVDGVVWMKWRERTPNYSDQFKLDDPYGRDCGDKDCIAELLRVTTGAEKNPDEASRHRSGYRFVETADPADQKRYRYVGVIELGWSPEAIERHKKATGQDPPPPPDHSYRFTIKRTQIENYTARYGITWDDISTREDREHWIAGGSLKVIDLQTNEVVAERIGYMVDKGQGSQAGFRQPWSFAKDTACPVLVDENQKQTRIGFTERFVRQVVIPSSQE